MKLHNWRLILRLVQWWQHYHRLLPHFQSKELKNYSWNQWIRVQYRMLKLQSRRLRLGLHYKRNYSNFPIQNPDLRNQQTFHMQTHHKWSMKFLNKKLCLWMSLITVKRTKVIQSCSSLVGITKHLFQYFT